MNNIEQGFTQKPQTKSSRLARFKRVTIWIAGCFIAAFASVIIMKVMLAGGGERTQNLNNFSQSPWLLLFRICIYFLLWRNWKSVLALRVSAVTDELVRSSRRPLLMLIICYEVFFASNFLQYIV
jgi:hypothetical protein